MSPHQEAPPSPLPSLSPQSTLGGFCHIKMFGLMGLSRLHRGKKKGPLFSWLLRCVLTYFWDAGTDRGGHRVDGGGHGGGRSQLPWVWMGAKCSLIWGWAGRSWQARLLAQPLNARNTLGSQLCDLRPALPFWASVSPFAR